MKIATLQDGANPVVEMPCWFKYIPYIPKKRIKVTQTSKGSFSQKSLPLFLPGNEYIDWEIELIDGNFLELLRELYVLTGMLTFVGFYNDEYLVEFSELDVSSKSGYFSVK